DPPGLSDRLPELPGGRDRHAGQHPKLDTVQRPEIAAHGGAGRCGIHQVNGTLHGLTSFVHHGSPLALLERGLLVLMCRLSSRTSFRGAVAKRRRARNPYSLTWGYGFRALGLRPSPGMTGQGLARHASSV